MNCPHCGQPMPKARRTKRTTAVEREEARKEWYYELENRHYQWRAQHIFYEQPGCIVRPRGRPVERDWQI